MRHKQTEVQDVLHLVYQLLINMSIYVQVSNSRRNRGGDIRLRHLALDFTVVETILLMLSFGGRSIQLVIVTRQEK